MVYEGTFLPRGAFSVLMLIELISASDACQLCFCTPVSLGTIFQMCFINVSRMYEDFGYIENVEH